jgi:hypothetical protein
MKNIIKIGTLAFMASAILVPVAANAQDYRREQTANEWRNIAVISGALGFLGALNHDDTLTFAGAAGALYSSYRFNEDIKSLDRYDRARAEYFNRDYFYRDGHRYERREVWQHGQRYYQFVNCDIEARNNRRSYGNDQSNNDWRRDDRNNENWRRDEQTRLDNQRRAEQRRQDDQRRRDDQIRREENQRRDNERRQEEARQRDQAKWDHDHRNDRNNNNGSRDNSNRGNSRDSRNNRDNQDSRNNRDNRSNDRNGRGGN